MPAIYLVITPNGDRLIEANNKSSAINHVVKNMFTAETLKASEVAKYMTAGMKLETIVSNDAEKPPMEDAISKAEKALKNAG